MNTQTRQEGNASVVTIQGKLNFEVTGQLREVIRETITTQQPKMLVINFEGVDHLDSSGLGLIVAVHNNMDRNKGKFHLCCVSPAVKDIFERTNLTKFFLFFATEQDALSE